MKIGLFVTCLVNVINPKIGIASYKLLEAANLSVTVAQNQTCCGQPAFNSGYRKEAEKIATHTLKVMNEFDYIVTPSGSCAGMMKTHYVELLQNVDAKKINKFTLKIYELTDFLEQVIDWQPTLKNHFLKTVTYHDSCASLRELDIKQQPRNLLKKCGIEIIEMPNCEECCGFGGAFSVKFPDISSKMADKKCQHSIHSKADVVTMSDLGCLMNIEGRMSRLKQKNSQLKIPEVKHISEILAEANNLI